MRGAIHCPAGGASSAAKVSGSFGVREWQEKVFIPGEGWVRWREIQAQVDEAHRRWRQKMAMMGRFIFDGSERTRAEIIHSKKAVL